MLSAVASVTSASAAMPSFDAVIPLRRWLSQRMRLRYIFRRSLPPRRAYGLEATAELLRRHVTPTPYAFSPGVLYYYR